MGQNRRELVETDVDASAPGNTASLEAMGAPQVSWVADLTAFTGTDITFHFQHSRDNSTWYTIASTAAQTGVGTSVRTTRENVFPYVRISWTETAVSAATVTFVIQTVS